MHPEIVSYQPGDCPKCGMALELIATSGPRTGTIYTCPMHPQVVYGTVTVGVVPAAAVLVIRTTASPAFLDDQDSVVVERAHPRLPRISL